MTFSLPQPSGKPRLDATKVWALMALAAGCLAGLWYVLGPADSVGGGASERDSLGRQQTDSGELPPYGLKAKFCYALSRNPEDPQQAIKQIRRHMMSAEIPFRAITVSERQPGERWVDTFASWPRPLPVAIFGNGQDVGVLHPIGSMVRCGSAIHEAVEVADWNKMKTGKQLLRAGSFDGDCLGDSPAAWRITAEQKAAWPPGDGVSLDSPKKDAPRALRLSKLGDGAGQTPVSCTQDLGPHEAGTGDVMCLRVRAWAEGQIATLQISLLHNLIIQEEDDSPTMLWLREVARGPAQAMVLTGGPVPVTYQVGNTINLGAEPRTYLIMWEWPPTLKPAPCGLTLSCRGGTVWVEEVGAFAWPSTEKQ